MELLDEVQIRAINNANGKNLPEAPTLMFEFIGTGAYDISWRSHNAFLCFSSIHYRQEGPRLRYISHLLLPYFCRFIIILFSLISRGIFT